MSAPTPNAELAYKVLDHIDAHPEQHDQRDFVRKSDNAMAITAETMPCGTTACFAGWTVMLSGRTLELNHIVPKAELDGRLVEVDDVAALLLGIGRVGMYDDRPHALFYEAETREDLGRLVAEIFGPRPGGTDCLCPGEVPHPELGMQPGAAAEAHFDDVPPNAGSTS